MTKSLKTIYSGIFCTLMRQVTQLFKHTKFSITRKYSYKLSSILHNSNILICFLHTQSIFAIRWMRRALLTIWSAKHFRKGRTNHNIRHNHICSTSFHMKILIGKEKGMRDNANIKYKFIFWFINILSRIRPNETWILQIRFLPSFMTPFQNYSFLLLDYILINIIYYFIQILNLKCLLTNLNFI
jgi:hypothetical protein